MFILFLVPCHCQDRCSSFPVTSDCRSWGTCTCANVNVCTPVYKEQCGTRQKCHYTYDRRRLLSRRGLRRGSSRSSSRSSYKSSSYKYKSYKYKSSYKAARQVCNNVAYCENVKVSETCIPVLNCQSRRCPNYCCKQDNEVCAEVGLYDISFTAAAMPKRTYSLSKICPLVVSPNGATRSRWQTTAAQMAAWQTTAAWQTMAARGTARAARSKRGRAGLRSMGFGPQQGRDLDSGVRANACARDQDQELFESAAGKALRLGIVHHREERSVCFRRL